MFSLFVLCINYKITSLTFRVNGIYPELSGSKRVESDKSNIYSHTYHTLLCPKLL